MTLATGRVPQPQRVGRLRLAYCFTVAGLAVLTLCRIEDWQRFSAFRRPGGDDVPPLVGADAATERPRRAARDVAEDVQMSRRAARRRRRAGASPSEENGTRTFTELSHYPRIIAVDHGLGASRVPFKPLQQMKGRSVPPPRRSQENATGLGEGSGKCKPMHEWQLRSFPNCNCLHEADVTRMRIINSGKSRIAFEMTETADGEETRYVYKTMKYRKKINGVAQRQQRIDGLIMERTSTSDFVPDLHGFCGVAELMEHMPGGTLHDYVKGARLAGDGSASLAPRDKLRVLLHLARGVADLHAAGGGAEGRPAFVHNDLFPHQFLFKDGYFKLNDFHASRPIYVSKATNETCPQDGFGVGLRKKRSLENHLRALKHPDYRPADPDKTDVWMMGNVMYTVLTDLYLFEKPRNLNLRETSLALAKGLRSPYPAHIANSTDPAVRASREAVDACWTHDARERPSARSVTERLLARLREVAGEEAPDLRVTLPARDPDQALTSSDYNRYNYDYAMSSTRESAENDAGPAPGPLRFLWQMN